MEKEKPIKIESVDEMLKGFESIKKNVNNFDIASRAIVASADTENILEVVTKYIAKFGPRASHILLPKRFVDHEAKIIIRKNTKPKEEKKS